LRRRPSTVSASKISRALSSELPAHEEPAPIADLLQLVLTPGHINQIWLNNQFQLALLELLNNAKSIPYDSAGNNLIESALADPIQAGLNFGAYAPGSISQAQIAEVNSAAGSNISQTLQTQGYYLQVLPATSIVREARGSPPINFWYLDRGSIQLMTMDSIAVV
jgi:hypothetical protein